VNKKDNKTSKKNADNKSKTKEPTTKVKKTSIKIKNEDNIKIPKTKVQKLKIKHKQLIAIAIVLAVIFIGLFFIGEEKTETKLEKENKTETKTEEPIEKLTVYNQDSNERPYAVMIPNDSEAKKRQYGIQKAYLTYEITVEGGITRLLALYKDVNVDKIGPTRSSRHYYLDYVLENDAIYVHFGWSPQAQSDISSLGINNLNGLYNPANMFWRDKQYGAPNNAFTSTDNIKKAANDKGYRMTSDNYEIFNYKKEVDLSSDSTYKTAKNVKIDYAGSAYVKYIYDETNKYYLRYNNEKQHLDLATNEQVHVTNIIVLKMNTINISGDEKGRQNLNNIGSGEGYYITKGQSIKITWTKDSRSAKTIYKNMNGEEINVSDGNTFIQIQPTNKSTTIE